MNCSRLVVNPIADVFPPPVERMRPEMPLGNEVELARLKLQDIRTGTVGRNCNSSSRYIAFNIVESPAIVFPAIDLEMNRSRLTIEKGQSGIGKKNTSAWHVYRDTTNRERVPG